MHLTGGSHSSHRVEAVEGPLAHGGLSMRNDIAMQTLRRHYADTTQTLCRHYADTMQTHEDPQDCRSFD